MFYLLVCRYVLVPLISGTHSYFQKCRNPRSVIGFRRNPIGMHTLAFYLSSSSSSSSSSFRHRCTRCRRPHHYFSLSLLYSSLSSLLLCNPCLFLIISTLGNVDHPWRLRTYCCVHWDWRAQVLICFGSHKNYSGSSGVPSNILGWWMTR